MAGDKDRVEADPKTKADEDEDDDLDIVEVDDGSDDEVGDERLSADQRDASDGRDIFSMRISDLTPEEKRERRRIERRGKKDHRNYRSDEKDDLISMLSDQVTQLEQRTQAITGESIQRSASEIRAAANHWQAKLRQAEAIHAKAVAEGDGQAAVYAQRLHAEAQQNLHGYSNAWANLNRVAQHHQSQAGAQRLSPQAQRLATTFQERHAGWYNQPGFERETRAMIALDTKVIEDGYPPDSPEYWEELEERAVKHRLLGDLVAQAEGGRRRRVSTRGGPPLGGRTSGRAAGQGRTIELPKTFVRMMKQAGQWDNPKLKKQTINDYLNRMKAQEGA